MVRSKEHRAGLPQVPAAASYTVPSIPEALSQQEYSMLQVQYASQKLGLACVQLSRTRWFWLLKKKREQTSST
jgi:hypothetical protein